MGVGVGIGVAVGIGVSVALGTEVAVELGVALGAGVSSAPTSEEGTPLARVAMKNPTTISPSRATGTRLRILLAAVCLIPPRTSLPLGAV